MTSSKRRGGQLQTLTAVGLLALVTGCGESDSSGSTASGGAGDSSSVSANGGTTSGTSNASGGTSTSTAATGWLYTEDNHIYRPDGTVFHGRGANVHDTRSCWSCSWNEPSTASVIHQIDALVDDWGANFIRLVLEQYGADSTEAADGAIQYGTVLEDPAYLANIKTIVDHIGTKPGVVVLLSDWGDPTHDAMGWPTSGTIEIWRALANTFLDSSHVMFGLVNEPQSNYDGSQDAACWGAMNDTVAAIREVEESNGKNHHVIAVQGTGGWARLLSYYTTHPITAHDGVNIAYEVHVYDPESEFNTLFVTPAQTLPVIIGEFGAVDTSDVTMSLADCSALMEQAEQLEVPYLAWTFHPNCPPNLLQTTSSWCGTEATFQPTEWGTLLRNRLAQAY